MTISQSIRATLAYHDLFDYPLTASEISLYLIEKRATPKQVKKELISSKFNSLSKNGLYAWNKKRLNLLPIRAKREKISGHKLKRAKYFSKLLALIPTVKLVAITGALAMNNCTKNDDIDLLIISSKKTLWTTRFLANVLLFPYRRFPKSKKQNNKACLNIFLDESDLYLRDRNLYTAHEVAQMKPLYNNGNTYSKFIKANSWVYTYLPNWKQHTVTAYHNKNNFVSSLAHIFEKALKILQSFYMHSKITTEQISDTQLFFHPKSTQTEILGSFKRKVKKLKLDLKDL